jgi:hypothetical protein
MLRTHKIWILLRLREEKMRLPVLGIQIRTFLLAWNSVADPDPWSDDFLPPGSRIRIRDKFFPDPGWISFCPWRLNPENIRSKKKGTGSFYFSCLIVPVCRIRNGKMFGFGSGIKTSQIPTRPEFGLGRSIKNKFLCVWFVNFASCSFFTYHRKVMI